MNLSNEDRTNACAGRLVPAIFCVSGAASMILQVVWFKQLQFILGSSTLSVSVTVASFFLGLSIGGVYGGRVADDSARPLRVYALLEASLGFVSIAVTAMLREWTGWVGWITPFIALDSPLRLPIIIIFSFAILALPTFLMGATLPLVIKSLVHSRSDLAQQVGRLYGLNTLGAAIGCLAAGFILIGLLGLTNTSLFASASYFLIAALAFFSARFMQSVSALDRAKEPQESGLETESDVLLVFVFACSGFASIAYEIVWFRLLANASNASVYAFSGMLGTYLFGLVIGAFVCSKFLAPHKDRLLRYFALTQALIGAASMLTIATLGRAATFQSLLAPLVLDHVPERIQTLLGMNVVFFFVCFISLILPTTLIGVSFPLASEIAVTRTSVLGRRIGRLYAANTIGGVLGSLSAGFVLLPYLGSQWTLLILISINFTLFGVVLASNAAIRADRLLRREGALAFAFVAAGFLMLGPHYLENSLTSFQGATVLEMKESPEATFTVLEYEDIAAGRYQQLLVNSKSYANNRPEGRRYMAALGHYPILLHDNPVDKALVICIGTGTTVGAVSVHDEVSSVYAVDLAPDVFRFAKYFAPLNKNFPENPKVHKVVADGRHYLLTTRETFDVITLEPPPPHDAGIVNLYTEEFYALAKTKMREGAILAQWAPLDMPRGVLPKMIIKAMLAQFRHVSLWLPNRMEGIVIGSDTPLQIDPGLLAQRMSMAKVAKDLDEIGIRSPEHFLGTFVAADQALSAYVSDVPTITDDLPRIEYYNFYPPSSISMSEIRSLRESIEPRLVAKSLQSDKVEAARKVVDAIWDEHEAAARDDLAGARAALEMALRLEPENQYLLFLERKQLSWASAKSGGR
jgi:spermidine synthase